MKTKKMDLSFGILYVATRKESFLVEAIASAESLKRQCPTIPVCLFTDLIDSEYCDAVCFDIVETVASDLVCTLDWAQGLRARMLSLPNSPFDMTCHIDTDTRFLSDAIGELYHVLDEHEIAMVEDPAEISISVRYTQRRMFNGGMILYKKTPKIHSLFDKWNSIYLQQLRAYEMDPLPSIPQMDHIVNANDRRKRLICDQCALMGVLSPVNNTFDVKLKILDAGWNYCRTSLGEATNYPIHIEHGPQHKAHALDSTVVQPQSSLPDMLLKVVAHTSNAVVSMEQHFSDGFLPDVNEDAGRKAAKAAWLEASYEISQAFDAIPNKSLVTLQRAKKLLALNDFDAAIIQAKKTIVSDQTSFDGFEVLIRGLIAIESYKEAGDAIRRCYYRLPDRPWILAYIDCLPDNIALDVPELPTHVSSPFSKIAIPQTKALCEDLIEFLTHHHALARTSAGLPECYQTIPLQQQNGVVIEPLQSFLLNVVKDYCRKPCSEESLFTQFKPKRLNVKITGYCLRPGAQLTVDWLRPSWLSGIFYLAQLKNGGKTNEQMSVELGAPMLPDIEVSSVEKNQKILLSHELALFPGYRCYRVINTSVDTNLVGFRVEVGAAPR